MGGCFGNLTVVPSSVKCSILYANIFIANVFPPTHKRATQTFAKMFIVESGSWNYFPVKKNLTLFFFIPIKAFL